MADNIDFSNNKMVSIGIPTYNRPDSLRRILDIATSQTYPNLEIIVSDNASPDEKVKNIAEEFSRKDNRIKYYRQELNIGILANTEFVLKKATGEYFTWFSDDDWRSSEFIEILVSKLKENENINMAFCDYHEVYKDGSPALEYPKTHLSVFEPFTSEFRLIRTMAYYWQDAIKGKQNLFYSIFRKASIDALDLKKISGEYKNLNMDSLIVFSLLQFSSVVIVPKLMCNLTCGNKKYYKLENSGEGFVEKFMRVFYEHKNDGILFVKNTDSLLEKTLICILFFPRLWFIICLIVFKKILSRSKCYFIGNE